MAEKLDEFHPWHATSTVFHLYLEHLLLGFRQLGDFDRKHDYATVLRKFDSVGEQVDKEKLNLDLVYIYVFITIIDCSYRQIELFGLDLVTKCVA